jgi:small subunit ribosomal protein S8
VPALEPQAALAEILRDEGFVQSVTSAEDNKQGMLKLTLATTAAVTGIAITGMRRVSRPASARTFRHAGTAGPQRPRYLPSFSTSQGVMTDREARTKGVAAKSSARSGESCRASDVNHSRSPRGPVSITRTSSRPRAPRAPALKRTQAIEVKQAKDEGKDVVVFER